MKEVLLVSLLFNLAIWVICGVIIRNYRAYALRRLEEQRDFYFKLFKESNDKMSKGLSDLKEEFMKIGYRK